MFDATNALFATTEEALPDKVAVIAPDKAAIPDARAAAAKELAATPEFNAVVESVKSTPSAPNLPSLVINKPLEFAKEAVKTLAVLLTPKGNTTPPKPLPAIKSPKAEI